MGDPWTHEQHNEKISIKRVRQLRIKIKNESGMLDYDAPDIGYTYDQDVLSAKT